MTGGSVSSTKVHYMSLRGFEKFIVGKPRKKCPGFVNRICGICPWQSPMASNKAVDRCFGVTLPRPGGSCGDLPDHVPCRRQAAALLFSGGGGLCDGTGCPL